MNIYFKIWLLLDGLNWKKGVVIYTIEIKLIEMKLLNSLFLDFKDERDYLLSIENLGGCK